jgi:hypothetical protein
VKATGLAVSLALASLSSGAWAQEKPAARSRQAGDLREQGTLKAGDKAPDFSLKTLDGKQTVKLSGFQGKKPVALVFGSYT